MREDVLEKVMHLDHTADQNSITHLILYKRSFIFPKYCWKKEWFPVNMLRYIENNFYSQKQQLSCLANCFAVS